MAFQAGVIEALLRLRDEFTPQIKAAAVNAKAALGGIINADAKLTDAQKELKKSFESVAAGVAIAGAAIAAATAAIVAMGIHGSDVGDVADAFDTLSASAGQSSAALLEAGTKGAAGMISSFDLMKASNEAMLLGMKLTPETMKTLSEGAATLGDAIGKGPVEMFETLTLAVARGQDRLLKQVGIDIDAEQSQLRYATSIGKTVSSLTEAEKKQALYAATIEAVKAKTIELGGVTLSFADRVEQIKVAVTNFYDALSRGVAESPVFGAALKFIAEGMQGAFGDGQQSMVSTIMGMLENFAVILAKSASVGLEVVRGLSGAWAGFQLLFSGLVIAVTGGLGLILTGWGHLFEMASKMPGPTQAAFQSMAASAKGFGDQMTAVAKGEIEAAKETVDAATARDTALGKAIDTTDKLAAAMQSQIGAAKVVGAAHKQMATETVAAAALSAEAIKKAADAAKKWQEEVKDAVAKGQDALAEAAQHTRDVALQAFNEIMAKAGELGGSSVAVADKALLIENAFDKIGDIANITDAGLTEMITTLREAAATGQITADQSDLLTMAFEEQEARALELGITLHEAGGHTNTFAEDMKSAQETLNDISGILGEVGGLMGALGVDAESTAGRTVAALTDIAGSAASMAGAIASGDPAAMVQAGIGLATSLISGITSVFSQPEWVQSGIDAGNQLGVALSEEFSQVIQDTMDELDVSPQMAALLNITGAAEDAGVDIRTMTDDILNLIYATRDGSVPAAEGIQQISDSWDAVRESATNAGLAVDASTIAIVQAAQATGQMTQGMRDYLAAASAQQSSGFIQVMEGLAAGMEEAFSPAQGHALGVQFEGSFWAAVGKDGLLAAADAMGPAFDLMVERGGEVGEEIGHLMDLSLNSEMFRGAAQVGQGLKDELIGVAQQGMLTTDMFAALGTTAMQARDQAIAGGANQREALVSVMPYLQQAVQTASQLGIALDPDTQNLVDGARDLGIAIPVEPMTQLVELMRTLVTGLGFALPQVASQTGTALAGVATAGQVAGAAIRVGIDDGTASIRGMRESVDATAVAVAEVAKASEEAASEIEKATSAASKDTEEQVEKSSDAAISAFIEMGVVATDQWDYVNVAANGTLDKMKGNIEALVPVVTDSFTQMQEDSTGQVLELARAASELASNMSRAAGAAGTLTGNLGGATVPTYEPPEPGTPWRYNAEGFKGLIDRPTVMVIGEEGPEDVDIRPRRTANGGGGGSQGFVFSPQIHVGISGSATEADGRAFGTGLNDELRSGAGETMRLLKDFVEKTARGLNS